MNLNLLPYQAKKELKQVKNFNIISQIFIYLLAINSFFTVPLLLGNIQLKNQFIATVEQTTQTNIRPTATVELDVSSINNKLKTIIDIQNEYIPWSNLIILLAESAPEGIIFTGINANAQNEKSGLSITGHAVTRDNFLELQSKLEENDIIAAIDSPIKNISKKEDIDFILNIELALETL